MNRVYRRLLGLEDGLHRQLVRHRVSALRLAGGTVFLAFGALRCVPAVSPAHDPATRTKRLLPAQPLDARGDLAARRAADRILAPSCGGRGAASPGRVRDDTTADNAAERSGTDTPTALAGT